MTDKSEHKTTGLYKIAAKIIKNVKTGYSYKTQLYQAQYPNKLILHAVLMNVFKWEPVINVLIEKTNILEKESFMDRELVYVLITELMWSKFGLKGNARNILAIKKYQGEFTKLVKENELEKLISSFPIKVSKPRFFRVNTLVTSVEDMLKKLTELKYEKLKTPDTYAKFLELIKSNQFKPNTFVQDIHIKELFVFHPNVKFYKIKEYNDGALIIQDKASCLASYLLNPEPESTVLDMCAAPGMKTSHIASIMQNKGKLYAVDRCPDRFKILENMLQKYGVKNVEAFNMDSLRFPYVDDVKYILVDPSCSGSGIVSRVRNDSLGQNENLKSRLKKLSNVHAQLLNHAFKHYPKLERLVYSTCSANPEENEVVVDEALSVNGTFKLLDCTKMVKGWTNKGNPGYDCSEMCLNAVPDIDCTNGFFIAVFVRRDYEEKIDVDDESNSVNVEESNSVDFDKESNSVNVAVESNSVPCIKTGKNLLMVKKTKTNEKGIIKKSKNARRKERKLRQLLGDEQLDSKQLHEKIKKPKDLKGLKQSDTKQLHEKIKKPNDLEGLEQSDTKQLHEKIKKPNDLEGLEQSDAKQLHEKIKKPNDLEGLEQSDAKQSHEKINKPKKLKRLEQSGKKHSLLKFNKLKKFKNLEKSDKEHSVLKINKPKKLKGSEKLDKKRSSQDSEESPEKIKKSKKLKKTI